MSDYGKEQVKWLSRIFWVSVAVFGIDVVILAGMAYIGLRLISP